MNAFSVTKSIAGFIWVTSNAVCTGFESFIFCKPFVADAVPLNAPYKPAPKAPPASKLLVNAFRYASAPLSFGFT